MQSGVHVLKQKQIRANSGQAPCAPSAQQTLCMGGESGMSVQLRLLAFCESDPVGVCVIKDTPGVYVSALCCCKLLLMIIHDIIKVFKLAH